MESAVERKLLVSSAKAPPHLCKVKLHVVEPEGRWRLTVELFMYQLYEKEAIARE